MRAAVVLDDARLIVFIAVLANDVRALVAGASWDGAVSVGTRVEDARVGDVVRALGAVIVAIAGRVFAHQQAVDRAAAYDRKKRGCPERPEDMFEAHSHRAP